MSTPEITGVSQITMRGVRIEWTIPVSRDVLSYQISLRPSGGDWTVVADSLPRQTTSYDILHESLEQGMAIEILFCNIQGQAFTKFQKSQTFVGLLYTLNSKLSFLDVEKDIYSSNALLLNQRLNFHVINCRYNIQIQSDSLV